MINSNKAARSIFALLLGACLLAGCGGTKVLKEAQPIQPSQPLAAASNQDVTATLDWVIVRDGPGTWAKNADWDEYLMRVSNASDQPIRVISVTVVDSLDTRVDPQPQRKLLVKGSKQSARRYRKSGIKVKAGRSAGTLLVAGTAVTAVGGATAATVGYGVASSSAGVVAGGLLLMGPALAVGGIVRGVRNSAVNKQIELKQTAFPVEVPAGEVLAIDVFFPLAPSPTMVEVIYVDATGETVLVVDTSAALRGLHIKSPD